ncbi:DciA family protein [Sedimentitalea sp. JM2-8]|uniref:DciA family protein n=1 Tax=Sedimentitalea xiamensis TaxID=3050037 RepID=A0ABT7F9F7_9RHOB|nr:DciA family protein [Sedimentitalea xiamensis]MDK3071600.1 DciA family protein [Sedimentitalea xiamensis]
MARRETSTRGFKRTASVLSDQIRRAGESRGFAVSRLLTHWAEIAGPEIAAIARPVNVSYGRGGFGATLTVLTTGAQAPMLEMRKEQLRAKVNAVYGYNAISRVRITQTAPTGFAEGQAVFEPRKADPPPAEDPKIVSHAAQAVRPIDNDELRAALERLGRNVLSRPKH